MRTNVDNDTDQSGSNEGVKAMDTSEWLEETGKMHIHRADMNKLIMNYLVMGEFGGGWTICEGEETGEGYLYGSGWWCGDGGGRVY